MSAGFPGLWEAFQYRHPGGFPDGWLLYLSGFQSAVRCPLMAKIGHSGPPLGMSAYDLKRIFTGLGIWAGGTRRFSDAALGKLPHKGVSEDIALMMQVRKISIIMNTLSVHGLLKIVRRSDLCLPWSLGTQGVRPVRMDRQSRGGLE